MKKSKLKRITIITFIVIVAFVAIVLIFISPIAKYVIEKQDEKLLGRQVKVGWIYLNPFTGYVYLRNLKIFESKSDSIFFAAKGFSVNMSMLKLMRKTYEISDITLNGPYIKIIQNKQSFNFDDLLQKFSSSEEKPDTTAEPAHFNALNLKIKNGVFHYIDEVIPVNYFIKKVDIESPGIKWNVDTTSVKFSFLSGPTSGEISGSLSFNLSTFSYRMTLLAKKFDLQIVQQYMQDFSKYGSFSANLDADLKASGNLKDPQNVNGSGTMALNDFHFGKSKDEDYVSFSKLNVGIAKLSPRGLVYNFDSITLFHPEFKYEKYDSLDNIQRMFGEGGSEVKEVNAARDERFNLIIELAHYVKLLAQNFFRSHYKLGKAAVYGANLQFNDYSLNEKFSIAANPFNVMADSIDRKGKQGKVKLETNILPYGKFVLDLTVNPKDTGEFTLTYNLNKLPLSMFNPYLITFTSYPLDRGTLEFKGNWEVKNGMLQSMNRLQIIDPHLTDRLKRKDTKNLPVPLIFAFVRERGGSIDYEIPIRGDLRDPKFNIWDVVLDLLRNIFVKPPSIPYMSRVRNIENKVEKFLTVKWLIGQTNFTKGQEKFLRIMNDFLEESSEASISVTPLTYVAKEKEYILYYEAKKRYYLLINKKNKQSFNEEDSLKVYKMSVKDSAFVHFMDRKIKDTTMFTVQQKCTVFLGMSANKDSLDLFKAGRRLVDIKYQHLAEKREDLFRSFFKKDDVKSRVKFMKEEATVPFNGFSFYKIDYKGDIPENLQKAYNDMNEIKD